MNLSRDEFDSMLQLLDYFDQLAGLKDFYPEAYESFEEILADIEKRATTDDGYCAWCSGVRTEWAWEMNGDMKGTGSGFWFCPNCGTIYHPRCDGGWCATRQVASPPMHTREGTLARQKWLNLSRQEDFPKGRTETESVYIISRDGFGVWR